MAGNCDHVPLDSVKGVDAISVPVSVKHHVIALFSTGAGKTGV
jgi:hypothetical protein